MALFRSADGDLTCWDAARLLESRSSKKSRGSASEAKEADGIDLWDMAFCEAILLSGFSWAKESAMYSGSWVSWKSDWLDTGDCCKVSTEPFNESGESREWSDMRE